MDNGHHKIWVGFEGEDDRLVSDVDLKPIVNLQIVVGYITLLYAIIITSGLTLTFSTFNDLFALRNHCNSKKLSESRKNGMFDGGGRKDAFFL